MSSNDTKLHSECRAREDSSKGNKESVKKYGDGQGRDFRRGAWAGARSHRQKHLHNLEKGGQLEYVQKYWTMGILVLIYKKADHMARKSYKPIKLLSHVRKVIERAISMMVNAQYNFDDSQLGFRRGTGTDTAISRHISNARTMKLGAVLDLRSAYHTVPRKKLHGVMKN